MDLSIGDKVSLLHDKEKGEIIDFKNDTTAIVLLDNGFEIPVLITELVGIHKAIKSNDPIVQPIALTTQNAGIYFIAEKDVSGKKLYILNNTAYHLSVSIFINKEKYSLNEVLGYKQLHVQPFELGQVGTEGHLSLNEIKSVIFEIDYFKKTIHHRTEHLSKTLSLKNILKANEKKDTLLNNAYQIAQIDTVNLNIDHNLIQDKLMENQHVMFSHRPKSVSARETIIDLHIEKIEPDYDLFNYSNEQIVQKQMGFLYQQLEQAIVDNNDKVVALHGAGNGILRQKVIDVFAKHPRVKRHEPGSYERFGAGATVAIIG